MRTLAILLTALLVAAALLVFFPSMDGVTTLSPNLPIMAGLPLAAFVAALAYWKGTRWGALLIVLTALFAAFIGQSDHTPLDVGPIVINDRPNTLFAGVLIVAVLVALSWRGLGKRASTAE